MEYGSMSKAKLVFRWIIFLPVTLLLTFVLTMVTTMFARLILTEVLSGVVVSFVMGFMLPSTASGAAPSHKRITAIVVGVIAGVAVILMLGFVLAIVMMKGNGLNNDFWLLVLYSLVTIAGLVAGTISGADVD